ncbi:SdrD B-like domain-containing protein, partial [Leucobacter sp. M11]|uniref:SdrD B-like domain-containing protein n=1 Tax=Leucobacter sp. M11 TaxID=2993565 RepID=UPI002D8052CF
MSFSQLVRSRPGVALLLAGVLALGGAVATNAASVTPAHASPEAPGELLAASIEITDDGVSLVPGDTSVSDGKLALGNEVSFRWELETSGAANLRLEQGLPVGWHWDVDSAVSAGLKTVSEDLGYRSSFRVAEDGRTLFAEVGSISGDQDTQTIRFDGIRARTDRNAAQTGEQYVPTLIISEETGSRQVTPTSAPLHLETVGTLGVDLRAEWFNGSGWTDHGTPGAQMQESVHDFGSGVVAAGESRFRIAVIHPEGVGERPYQLPVPRKMSGTFSLTQAGAPWSGTVDLLIDNTDWNALDGEVEFDRAAGTFTITVTEATEATDSAVDLLFFVPRSELGNANDADNVLHLEASVALEEPWRTVESGETVTETNTANNRFNSVLTSWDDPAPWSYPEHVAGQFKGPGLNVYFGAVVPGEDLTSEGYYMPTIQQDPVTQRYTVTPATDVSVMQLWNPADLQLNPDAASFYEAYGEDSVGDPRTIEPGDLRYLLTTDRVPGTGRGESLGGEDLSALNWVDAGEYTGELAQVSGVRVEYLGNGGVWDAGGVTNSTSESILSLSVSLRVARGAPAQTDPEDTGEVRLVHAGTGNRGYALWPRVEELKVRYGQGTMTATGIGLDANGEPVTPATKTILAGQGVRYTLRPQLKTNLFGDKFGSRVGVTNLETRACVSPFATNIDFTPLDGTHWSAEIMTSHRVCAAEETELRFTYLLPATYLDPLADIVFDIETSQIAPSQSRLGLTAALFGDGIAPKSGVAGDAAATASFDMSAAQPSVARVELRTPTPVVEARTPMSYRVQWFNFTGVSRKASTFVDVLPYDGDPRGTNVSGEVVLTEATLASHEATGATLELTTDPKIREGQTGRAPATGVDWVAYADATPAEISAATALRVALTDHRPGPDSVGTLEVSLSAPQAANGEMLQNSVSGMLDIGGDNTRLAESKPVKIRIESAEIRGSVWNDVNRDGNPDNEPGLGGVSLALLDREGTPVLTADGTPWTEFTADDGSYRFPGLAEGEYRVTADAGTAEPAGH